MDKSVEGGDTVLRGRGLGKWHRGILIHSRGEVNKKNTLWVSGGSGAFRKSIWDKLGGLDPLYNPYYWEDIDLSYRAVKSGYSIVFEPTSTVIHEHEKGSIKTQHTADKITARAYRNQFIFVWKNITDSRLILDHCMWMPVHIGKATLRRDKEYLKGLYDALVLFPSILKSRKKSKRYFVRTDSEVVNLAPSV